MDCKMSFISQNVAQISYLIWNIEISIKLTIYCKKSTIHSLLPKNSQSKIWYQKIHNPQFPTKNSQLAIYYSKNSQSTFYYPKNSQFTVHNLLSKKSTIHSLLPEKFCQKFTIQVYYYSKINTTSRLKEKIAN
jgi:hypothetical protein